MEIRNNWGPPQTAAVVTGVDLLDKQVTFGGDPAKILVNDNTCLIFQVPSVVPGVYPVSVDTTLLGDFTVDYPSSPPEIIAVVPGTGGWYTLVGDQFCVGDTLVSVDNDPSVYVPTVMSPNECAVVLPTEPTSITLITPMGSFTYVKP